MSNQHVVLNDDAFADKGVARDLAASANTGIFLDLDECADLRLVPDLAPVQIDELREPDVLPQFHVVRDAVVGVHR
jgi:hypothetical protein